MGKWDEQPRREVLIATDSIDQAFSVYVSLLIGKVLRNISITRAVLLGLLSGMVYGLVNVIYVGNGDKLSNMLSAATGGALIGAVLFAIVAWIINWTVK